MNAISLTNTVACPELIPVRSSIERFFLSWFFVVVPAVYLLRLAVEYGEYGIVPYALFDSVKIAAELALLIVLTLANQFLAAVGPTILSLFANAVVTRGTDKDAEPSVLHATCRTLDVRLNHRLRVPFAGAVAGATLYYYWVRMGHFPAVVSSGSVLSALDTALYFMPTLFYAYFVGIIAWKVCATSLFLWSFPRQHNVVPRFLHPDGACGLLPIGDLCLRMMYVAVVPTALSGLFLIAHFAPRGMAGFLTPNATLLFRFTPLILFGGIIGLVIGFLPLVGFHRAIVAHRHEWTAVLIGLSDRIVVEKTKILQPRDETGDAAVDAALKTVAALQSQYDSSRKVRMWPVDGGQVTRIWSSVALVSGQLLAFIQTVSKVL